MAATPLCSRGKLAARLAEYRTPEGKTAVRMETYRVEDCACEACRKIAALVSSSAMPAGACDCGGCRAIWETI